MGLDQIRRLASPSRRRARSTFVSVLLMAAVALGLVAMHDPGVDHAAHGGTSAHASHGGEHADELAMSAATDAAAMISVATISATATTVVLGCDDACMYGLLDCAAVAMGCAMMIAFAVVLALAGRPAMFARIRDGGARILAAVRDSVAIHLRPDLHILSISRT